MENNNIRTKTLPASSSRRRGRYADCCYRLDSERKIIVLCSPCIMLIVRQDEAGDMSSRKKKDPSLKKFVQKLILLN